MIKLPLESGSIPNGLLIATAVALHHEIAASGATLCLATIEDLSGIEVRPNYPGTSNETHPNWCHRAATTTKVILDGLPAVAITNAMTAVRHRDVNAL